MNSLLKFRLTGLFLLFTVAGMTQGWEPPSRGILDLRDYDFNEESYIKLNGFWEFYWEQFVPPAAFHLPDPPKPTLYGKVPGYWIDYSNEEYSFTGTGYATYRLQVLLPEGFNRDIGFDIPVFDAAVRLFLDGREILTNGRPGTSEATSEAGYFPAITVYRPVSDTLEILLHVSNFQHRRGGFWKSMQIGSPARIIKTKASYRLVVYISLGVLLSFSLFFFFFYIFYRKDRVILSFALILAGVFIRMMNTDLFPVNYVLDLPWDWIIRLEYLGTFMAFGAALWYFYRLFPAGYMLWVTRVNTALVILSGLVILFFRVRIFAYTMYYFEPAIVVILLYYLMACAVSIFKGKRENAFFLAGLILFLAALVNDIMVANSMNSLSDSYTIHFALQIFVFIQAVLIIRSWVKAYREREKLMDEIAYINKNLENLVDQRTLELNRRNREINQKNEHIEARNRELKEALDFKNRVFSIIAHDLKSPVASLVQNSVLLDYDLSQEDNKKLINSFRELSNSALNLIDNLLYWGRSQGDQLKYNPELFDALPVMDGVLKLYHEMARQKSIKLEKETEGNTVVFADRELLEIIFRNLISNALKFTGKGGRIAIHSAMEAGGRTLLFTIEDNGVGIPGKRMKEIQGSNELISTAGTEKEKGTGLGLRLCQDLVAVNKGEMKIESREGEGTTVMIRLPAAPHPADPVSIR
jgi:signal transduction histidine kinase